MKRVSRTTAVVALLVLSGLIGVACGGSDDSGGGEAADMSAERGLVSDGMTVEQSAADDAIAVAEESASAGGSDATTAAALPSVGPSVIKTAQVRVAVEKEDFRDSVQDAISVAETAGGFVLSSEVGGGDERTGSITLRIPSENFERALGELKGLGEVKRERVAGQDVGQEFVDLRSRLRNYEAQEAVLLGLMQKASTVGASIRVQRELSGVQLEIEQLQGRIDYLEDQTEFGTITLDLVQAGVAPPKPASAIAKAWANAKDTFVGVVSAVIVGAGFVLPIALLLLIGAAIFRVVRPYVPNQS